jgi:hypothetical protein
MNGYSTAGNFDRRPDLLARLQNVVYHLNRPDIRTVSSLISKAIGDQNAGLMAVRLLHWFPKAKKASGWVYKSWRDWNAECNLSPAQVKRVHRNGFLETIGIERTIMKANGTPTVHYRLDEGRLIQKLTVFLGMMSAQIQHWMGPQSMNEARQNHPLGTAETDQPGAPKQNDELSEEEPMNSAESAQSITDSNSQNQQHKNDQVKQQYSKNSAVVVDTESEKKKERVQSLGKLGIQYFKAMQLIEKFGYKRIDEVVKQSEDPRYTNPAGYIIRALENEWILTSKVSQDDYSENMGLKYITGEYAAFINH